MRETMGANLYAGLKAHLFRARARNYESCLSAALDGDDVPETVYRNLVQQVRSRLPVLHRYFRARARALGLDRLSYHDLYCPLTSNPPRRYTPTAARRLVVESLKPLGDGYVGALEDAFRSRWIHWHPATGKRSGAYATGWAYDVHPYVLTNFTGDYEAVSTLAHEMGHAMHSWFSNRVQPFATADYSIFVAEVASTLNEALLSRRMLDTATDVQERTFLLGTWLDGMRGTLFRQTMFAQFELDIHERTERGEPLTGERLSDLARARRRRDGHRRRLRDRVGRGAALLLRLLRLSVRDRRRGGDGTRRTSLAGRAAGRRSLPRVPGIGRFRPSAGVAPPRRRRSRNRGAVRRGAHRDRPSHR
jgi:oligoendopeptidase F